MTSQNSPEYNESSLHKITTLRCQPKYDSSVKYSSLIKVPNAAVKTSKINIGNYNTDSKYNHSSDHKIVVAQTRGLSDFEPKSIKDPYVEVRKNGSSLSNQEPTFAPDGRGSSRGTYGHVRYQH